MEISVTKAIENLLKEKRYTKKDLAKGIGMSQQGISDLFKRKDMKVSVLKKIALFLETPAAYFIDNTSSNYQVAKGGSNIINDGVVSYSNSSVEKLKSENKELKKEVKYLKEINELLKQNLRK